MRSPPPARAARRRSGQLQIDVLERRLADRQARAARSSWSIAQPVSSCSATTGSWGHDQRAPAVDRAALVRHQRELVEPDAGGQREPDLGRPRVAPAELVGRAERDDLAVAHDRHAVGEVLRLVHEVRRQEHGLAELAQRPDRRPRRVARGRIKAGRRLVEEDQLRVADQRQRRDRAGVAGRPTARPTRSSRLAPSSTSSSTSSIGRGCRW